MSQEWPETTDFSSDALRTPWIRPLLDRIPSTAGLPRWMTAPHPEAVGSYGERITEWARDEMGIDLRWWQQLAMTRQYEHRADGTLCWRYVVESTPRRQGKSIRLKVSSCWRISHADLLGEPQTVVFTGKDLPICKEIHRGAWAWATAHGWTVRRGMGNEEIETADGSRWLVRSQNGIYGYPAGMGGCDESWAVPAAVITEGLQPALMERRNPQLHLTSTAHTRTTVLMRRRIFDALEMLDGSGDTLLMLWCAAPDADPGDETAWMAASPHWDSDRRQLVADAWRQIEAGKAVPDPLEPDPVSGFRAQYLNLWPTDPAVRTDTSGEMFVADGVWAAAADVSVPAPIHVVAAVEDRTGLGAAAACAGALSDGRLLVWGQGFRNRDAALMWAQMLNPSCVLVGASLMGDIGDLRVEVRKAGTAETASALPKLRELLAAGRLVHDGGHDLTGQVNGLRVAERTGGLVITSAGRSDVVRCAAWAVQAACQQPVRRPAWGVV